MLLPKGRLNELMSLISLPDALKSWIVGVLKNIMPLIRSETKEAFEKNLRREMKRGKPQKQALAIAYDVQRRAKRKKRRRA